ncbi:hypothetical protein [Deinococcus multiflagellatus]|uniref:Uncharacterized protein n=1 Tax=Deinococcus multiflagellatus TaxID=1656887 RepID=A0ABW1ZM78_9DEIO
MNATRYVITRPCLQEGSLRLLKYLSATFPAAGPVTLVDDRGQEHTAQVDPARQRVWGLGGLYHAGHLGVNDVLLITSLAPGRYQVEGIVKPHAPAPAPRREAPPSPKPGAWSSAPPPTCARCACRRCAPGPPKRPRSRVPSAASRARPQRPRWVWPR